MKIEAYYKAGLTEEWKKQHKDMLVRCIDNEVNFLQNKIWEIDNTLECIKQKLADVREASQASEIFEHINGCKSDKDAVLAEIAQWKNLIAELF